MFECFRHVRVLGNMEYGTAYFFLDVWSIFVLLTFCLHAMHITRSQSHEMRDDQLWSEA